MTELERRCLKGNATEIRRIANAMSDLTKSDTRVTEQGLSVYISRDDVNHSVSTLQERLEVIIDNIKNLKVVLKQPLKSE